MANDERRILSNANPGAGRARWPRVPWLRVEPLLLRAILAYALAGASLFVGLCVAVAVPGAVNPLEWFHELYEFVIICGGGVLLVLSFVGIARCFAEWDRAGRRAEWTIVAPAAHVLGIVVPAAVMAWVL